MDALMLTGFPGFLGSALLPRLLARRPGSTALCLVQPQHLATARERIAELERDHPHVKDRVELLAGDVTAPDLGLDATARTTVGRRSPKSGTSPPCTTSPSHT